MKKTQKVSMMIEGELLDSLKQVAKMAHTDISTVASVLIATKLAAVKHAEREERAQRKRRKSK